MDGLPMNGALAAQNSAQSVWSSGYGDFSSADVLEHCFHGEPKIIISTTPDTMLQGTTNMRILKAPSTPLRESFRFDPRESFRAPFGEVAPGPPFRGLGLGPLFQRAVLRLGPALRAGVS